MAKKTKQKPTESDTNTNLFEGLSPNQVKSLLMMIQGVSKTKIAEELKISRSTLYDWSQIETFRAAYNRLIQEVKSDLEDSLVALMPLALSTLKNCLEAENKTTSFKAATYLIERVRAQSSYRDDARTFLMEKARKDPLDRYYEIRGDKEKVERYVKLCSDQNIIPFPDIES